MAGPRPLGAVSLLALGVNGIVGVGIFFAPADVAARAPGNLGVATFLAVALALSPLALTFAALGARFDEDGGPVVYARAAFGETAAFAVGWIAYMSALASTAAVLTGLVAATLGGSALYALSLAAALAALVFTGLSLTATVWTAVTIAKLVPLVLLVGASLLSTATVPVDSVPVSISSTLSAALVVTFTFQGFEIVPVVAGAARGSSRTVPFAVLASLGGAAVLYVLLQRACVRGVADLAHARAPLVEAARFHGGPTLARIVEIGTSVSALGICIGMMAMTPRYLSSLARTTGLGHGLADVDTRGVPRRALFVTLALVATLIATGSRAQLFALSSVAVLSQYAFTSLAMMVLARRGERGLSRIHLALGVPSLLAALAIATGASKREWMVAAAALALGAVVRLVARKATPA